MHGIQRFEGTVSAEGLACGYAALLVPRGGAMMAGQARLQGMHDGARLSH